MYPEEGKKIGRTKNVVEENDSDFYYKRAPSPPHPPPRHKQDPGNMSHMNLIEL
jgi:hypothetical protein